MPTFELMNFRGGVTYICKKLREIDTYIPRILRGSFIFALLEVLLAGRRLYRIHCGTRTAFLLEMRTRPEAAKA